MIWSFLAAKSDLSGLTARDCVLGSVGFEFKGKMKADPEALSVFDLFACCRPGIEFRGKMKMCLSGRLGVRDM